MVADRRHACRLVDERDLDLVRADHARVDVGVRARAARGVEAGDEVGDRLVVVLDLDQADDVGVELRDRRDDLRPLPLELLRGVGAAAVQRREVVEDVERADGEVAADVLRPVRARVGDAVVGSLGLLDPVEAEGEVQHARHVRHRVAAAEPIAEVEDPAVGVDRGIRVLGVAAVVERDPAERIELCERGGLGRARLVHGGRLVLAPVGQDGLVEAVEVEVLADRERLRDRDEHPLVLLPFAERRERKRHGCRADRPLRRADREVRHADELRPAEGLDCSPQDADDVAGVDRASACHEQALRRVRIRIGVDVLFLDEEASQALRTLEVADDDALDDEREARSGALSAVALDVVDPRLLAVAALAERRRRRAAVGSAGRDRPEDEVDVVAVGVAAVRAARDPVRPVVGARSGALRVGSAGISLVAHRVDEGHAEPEAERVGRAVLDQIRLRGDVEVAVRRVRRVGADDVVIAGRERDVRKLERAVHRRPTRVAVDELQRVRVEVDRRGADVLQLEELRRVGRSAGRSRPR